jgi:tetratricopeptide (TPR) repeat protein
LVNSSIFNLKEVEPMVELASEVILFSCCCNHKKDKSLQQDLIEQLTILVRNNFITIQDSSKILAGKETNREIEAYLNNAHIILLLISPSFLYSDYFYNHVLIPAIERHLSGKAVVVPIILRDCKWNIGPLNNSKVKVLPTGGRPVTGKDWTNQNEAFKDIVDGIHKLLIDVWINVGCDHHKAKHYQKAIEAFEQALRLVDGATSMRTVAGIYSKKGNAYYEKEREENNDPLYKRYHNRMHYQERYQEAFTNFEKAISFDSGDASIRYFKGMILYENERYEDAFNTFEQAIQLDFSFAGNHIYKGLVLESMGELDQALATYDGYLKRRFDPAVSHFAMRLREHKERRRLQEQFPQDQLFDIQISRLHEELDQHKQHLEEQIRDRDQSLSVIKQTQTQLEETQKHLFEVKNLLDTHQIEAKRHQTELYLKELDEQIQGLDEEIRYVEELLRDLENGIKRLTDQIQEIEALLNNLKAKRQEKAEQRFVQQQQRDLLDKQLLAAQIAEAEQRIFKN